MRNETIALLGQFVERDRGDGVLLTLLQSRDSKVRAGYQGHHIVPVSSAQGSSALRRAADDLGYDINRAENCIALPATVEESLATGLPLHSGRHLSEYTDFVEGLLDDLDRRAGNLSDTELLDEIAKVEDQIREGLIDGTLRLQNADPRPRVE